jgi:hypothetical protein
MIVDDESFLFYAGKFYDTRRAVSSEDFYEDLKRFQYLKRLFKRYEENEDLKIRLILNHLIVLYNCFGLHATPMLFYKLEKYHHYLKPFLMFLNYLPKVVRYENNVVYTIDIVADIKIIEELRKI